MPWGFVSPRPHRVGGSELAGNVREPEAHRRHGRGGGVARFRGTGGVEGQGMACELREGERNPKEASWRRGDGPKGVLHGEVVLAIAAMAGGAVEEGLGPMARL